VSKEHRVNSKLKKFPDGRRNLDGLKTDQKNQHGTFASSALCSYVGSF